MNAELLAMLGGAGAVPSRREAEPKQLLSFKAGKMNAEIQPVSLLFFFKSIDQLVHSSSPHFQMYTYIIVLICLCKGW